MACEMHVYIIILWLFFIKRYDQYLYARYQCYFIVDLQSLNIDEVAFHLL